MGNLGILSKFIIAFYCIVRYVKGDEQYSQYSVFFLLLFIVLNLCFYVLNHDGLKKVILLLSTLLVLGCSFYKSIYLILFLPVHISEIKELFRIRSKWMEFVMLPLFIPLVDLKLLPEFILIFMFIYFFSLLLVDYLKKVELLIKENADFLEKNHSLNLNILHDKEYEKQMKYFLQIEERNRFSQYVHDNIGHVITRSIMQLEAARVIMSNDPVKAENILQNVTSILRDGMENLRYTLKNIKPTSQLRGVSKIKLLLDEFSANSNICTESVFSGDIDKITHMQWKIIQDNLVECLTNATKYSRAGKITFNLTVLNKYVKSEVKDNGIGALKIKKGIGIFGIEERAALLQGKVIIDGSDGFSIITLLPVLGE